MKKSIAIIAVFLLAVGSFGQGEQYDLHGVAFWINPTGDFNFAGSGVVSNNLDVGGYLDVVGAFSAGSISAAGIYTPTLWDQRWNPVCQTITDNMEIAYGTGTVVKLDASGVTNTPTCSIQKGTNWMVRVFYNNGLSNIYIAAGSNILGLQTNAVGGKWEMPWATGALMLMATDDDHWFVISQIPEVNN